MQTLFEKSISGRRSFFFKDNDFDDIDSTQFLEKKTSLLRTSPCVLPELSEIDIVRHYTHLSSLNKGIDNQFYPLGSCTMKYNPRLHEEIVAMEEFVNVHPLSPLSTVQGNLNIIYELEKMLSVLSGMDAFTLHPCAGAHGEFAGLMIIKAYHKSKNQGHRHKILIPDSAHGTNPASAILCGYDVVTIRSDSLGGVDIEHLKELLDDKCAGLMLTNPNTLGLFDQNILLISELVHDAGGLLYYDGANFNAIVGKCRPGDMGFDVIHLNLHKTFSTPHGGGGPGSGPVGVKTFLKEFLPTQRVVCDTKKKNFSYTQKDESNIRSLVSFHGHFLVYLRAYVYIKLLGLNGLKDVSETAVLNANYLMTYLKKDFYLPYDRFCMHEFVLSGKWQKKLKISIKHIAKRLIDKGYHPPTTYFPLIVEEALMIEPTETESKETLDAFIRDCQEVAKECLENANLVLTAPKTTKINQIDETKAARKPQLKCKIPSL